MKKISIIIMIWFLSLQCTDKLELKPNSNIVLPETVSDFESILDNTDVLNITPLFSQLSADEYFIPSRQYWESIFDGTIPRNAYIWNSDIYGGIVNIPSWNLIYNAIFYCNSVLDQVAEKDISEDVEMRNIKGWALFSRAYHFYSLASIFSKAYDRSSAPMDLGIPLKLTANIDEIVQRSTLQDTYDQIIADVNEASVLLKEDVVSDKKNRPTKAAAYALLARIYLSMRGYDLAEENADKSLSLFSKLIDYNSLDISSSISFDFNAEETLFFTRQFAQYGDITYSISLSYGLDSNLVALYESADLRLPIYFHQNEIGNYNYKGVNSGNSYPFTGLATDEMYLVKAECLARRQLGEQAMEALNTLLETRYKSGEFRPLTASNAQDALDKVLSERRKSLVWRSLRWTDLKRLNLENRNIILTRNLNGQTYVLEPNSPKYVLPIPDDEIAFSGIEQNVR